ncbi:MAG TPA: hypothetical protein VIL99_16315 [Ignavibacteria bacterium]
MKLASFFYCINIIPDKKIYFLNLKTKTIKLFNKECKICLKTHSGGDPPDIIIKFEDGKVVFLSIAKGNGTNPYPDGLLDKCIEEIQNNGGSLNNDIIQNLNNDEIYAYVYSLENEIQREYLKL